MMVPIDRKVLKKYHWTIAILFGIVVFLGGFVITLIKNGC